MAERHNALLAAAQLIEAVQQVVTAEPGRQVGTVGRLAVYPNAPNVVPGLVKHSIELRDLSAEKIARLGAEIQKQAQQIAQRTGTTITIKKLENDPPAMASPEIQKQIEAAAASARPQNHALAQRRRSRRPDDGQTRSHGHDLRPQR